MAEPSEQQITLTLPVPKHRVSDRGLVFLTDYPETQTRSHADRAMVMIDGETMPVAEAEAKALAILWLVREHYHGEGLAHEVVPS